MLFFFFTRVISDRLFLWKFVLDVYMFCFMFVSRQILWILKDFAVSWLLCGIAHNVVGDWLTFVSSPGVTLCDWAESTNKLTICASIRSVHGRVADGSVGQGYIVEGLPIAWLRFVILLALCTISNIVFVFTLRFLIWLEYEKNLEWFITVFCVCVCVCVLLSCPKSITAILYSLVVLSWLSQT